MEDGDISDPAVNHQTANTLVLQFVGIFFHFDGVSVTKCGAAAQTRFCQL